MKRRSSHWQFRWRRCTRSWCSRCRSCPPCWRCRPCWETSPRWTVSTIHSIINVAAQYLNTLRAFSAWPALCCALLVRFWPATSTSKTQPRASGSIAAGAAAARLQSSRRPPPFHGRHNRVFSVFTKMQLCSYFREFSLQNNYSNRSVA